jgi:hypothetical protein
MKTVSSSMTVFIPILVAFAAGFSCFLKHDAIFSFDSLLKILTMALGEFGFEEHFAYEQVNLNEGKVIYIRVPVLLIKMAISLVFALVLRKK